MSDPLRTDAPPAPPAIDAAAPAPGRDAKIEQLLLAGLDHYFAANYEQAITVWTRALFLDRSHARARAYIERARSALAERQRESEELLQNGLAAFNRGQGDEARRLLQAAINHGAPSDEALALLDRLSRLEPSPAMPRAALVVRPERLPLVRRTHEGARPGGAGFILSLAAIAMVAAGGMFLAGTDPVNWRSLVGLQPPPFTAPTLAATGDAGLPIPLRGETALARARALAASGHLHDALTTLDGVRPTDAQKADADRLRTEIQRELIGLNSAAPPDPPKGAGALP